MAYKPFQFNLWKTEECKLYQPIYLVLLLKDKKAKFSWTSQAVSPCFTSI